MKLILNGEPFNDRGWQNNGLWVTRERSLLGKPYLGRAMTQTRERLCCDISATRERFKDHLNQLPRSLRTLVGSGWRCHVSEEKGVEEDSWQCELVLSLHPEAGNGACWEICTANEVDVPVSGLFQDIYQIIYDISSCNYYNFKICSIFHLF